MNCAVRLCAVPMFALLAGCVSVQEIPLAPTAAESLRGRITTITTRAMPDFTAFTPGRAAFGGLGGASAVDRGNRLVSENGIEDPAGAIARSIAQQLKERYALTIASHTVQLDTDELIPLAKTFPEADLLLDVRTINWLYGYFPTAWNRYWIGYWARLRLIDVKRGQVLAEGMCGRKAPEESSNAQSEDQLLANSAQRLKSELANAAQFCMEQFRAATFAFAGPAPSIIAATPAATPATAPPASGPAQRTGAARVESAFWESIRARTDPADFQTYLEQFPHGVHAQAARDRIAALRPAVAVQPKSSTSRMPQAGDTWTYRLREPLRADGPKERSYVVKVAAANPGVIVEHYAVDGGPAGEWTHKGERQLLDLGKSLFAPYLLAFGEVANSSLGRPEIRDCGLTYICEATARVIGWEKIKVPAGMFDALKIEVRQEWQPVAMMGPQGAQLRGGRNLYVWYARETKRAVKFSSRATFGEVPPIDPDFDLELADYRLN